jgi:hypothetical protein
MSAKTTYQWLEPKPYKKHTRQLGIQGRNMIVWNLVADLVVSGVAPEEMARRFRLSVRAGHRAPGTGHRSKARWPRGRPSA